MKKTREQKIEEISRACREAHTKGLSAQEIDWKIFSREMYLNDVLLVIQKFIRGVPVDATRIIILDLWNLRTFALTEQSDECIDFVYNLL